MIDGIPVLFQSPCWFVDKSPQAIPSLPRPPRPPTPPLPPPPVVLPGLQGRPRWAIWGVPQSWGYPKSWMSCVEKSDQSGWFGGTHIFGSLYLPSVLMSVNMLNYHIENIDLPHNRKRTRMGMIYDPVIWLVVWNILIFYTLGIIIPTD